MRLALLMLALALPALATGASAPDVGQMPLMEGWFVRATVKDYPTLLKDTRAAIKAEGMVLVTEAGPTEAAANRGIEIPGNRVLGVFRNDFAVRALHLSVPAMIEAPIRLYVTENLDGTATLAYKLPSTVFRPYAEAAGPELMDLALELDDVFAAIAGRAIAE